MGNTEQQFQESTQTILDEVNRHYLDGTAQLGGAMLPSEHDDLLALFIQRELLDVTLGYAPSQLIYACREARRALANAELELGDVLDAISTLPSNEPLKAALSRADQAYHGGEAQLVENFDRGQRGDSLADFIAAGIRKAWYSSRDQAPVLSCVHTFDEARARLQNCIEAIEEITPAEDLTQNNRPKA
ncbi:hypothetical protein [Achromobacter sp. 2789STDY5608633]|uniref:hypothetical protein n=1 Tax=Achromobacter sp. 2789STDY5608633 TaxID=1806501 RepID=UPI0012E2538F|nr:hypothetical protein [Achromobacter sp. 2789STDY5608633]